MSPSVSSARARDSAGSSTVVPGSGQSAPSAAVVAQDARAPRRRRVTGPDRRSTDIRSARSRGHSSSSPRSRGISIAFARTNRRPSAATSSRAVPVSRLASIRLARPLVSHAMLWWPASRMPCTPAAWATPATRSSFSAWSAAAVGIISGWTIRLARTPSTRARCVRRDGALPRISTRYLKVTDLPGSSV